MFSGGHRETVQWARELIERQVKHMTHLVDDLLDVAGVTSGRFALRREVLDLAALVRSAVEDVRAAVERTGLRLEIDAPAPVWVEGDPTRLAQVVGNLLSNAGKFTDPGGSVTVKVTAAGGHAVLSVRDTGIGIAPELLPQLFQAFAQGERHPERSRGGLGLGLALVHGLVKLHGGTVEAPSEGPGRGAELTVRLPPGKAPREPTPPPPTIQPPARKRRVLMIEDNRDAAISLQLILELAGHEVTLAHTGPAGVEAAKRLRRR
jgi:signal transduction histidine kinase